jgi:uncharacterized protein (TIGR03083 family)
MLLAMRLSHGAHVDHIRSDAARLATAAARGLDAAVPSCPGWTVRDAVEHTAEVYRHKIACIRDKAFPRPWPPERDDEPTLDYFRRATDDLLVELTTRDPLEFADTWWWDERTVGFWGRRMAHETAIHLVDVELAHDDLSPIDDALALDGVDEVLRLMLAGDWSDEPLEDWPPAIVRVECVGTEWRVVMERSAVVAAVYRDRWPRLTVDATLAGPPVPLYLWLWGRGPDDELTVDGDVSAVRQLDARLRLATQ